MFSQGAIYSILETVNGITLTHREIDTISCLLSGKGTKSIAALLAVSPRTVEAHIRNLMLKYECNSREEIITLVEKTEQFLGFKNHYLYLLRLGSFKQALRNIANLHKQREYPAVMLYGFQSTSGQAALEPFITYLKMAGVNVILETQTPWPVPVPAVVPIVGMLLKKDHAEEEKPLCLFASNFAANIPGVFENTNMINISLDNKDQQQALEEFILNIFLILRKVFPSSAHIDTIITNFQKTTHIPQDMQKDNSRSSLLSKTQPLSAIVSAFFLQNRRPLIIGAISCTLLISFFAFPSYFYLERERRGRLVRSDLPIPTDSILLNRPDLLKKIKEKLNGTEGIQGVALIGIGGAGKTTIARQYAHQQKSSVVWEINAETNRKLRESFESFAYLLAATEEEKKALIELKNIQDLKEKEEKIIFFVKERLKINPGWLLLFDNVEKFSDIEKYFPSDVAVWGKGKVLITTRNSNMETHRAIQQTILVKELSSKEKLDLFVRIFKTGDAHVTSIKQEEIQEFLNTIPSFPLDISIAAHYLKATNISCSRYLEHLMSHDDNFETPHENILNEVGEYKKTRYSIIALSLQQILKFNNEFKDLLVLISLLDSKNIPKDFLNSFKNESIVENFIIYLKRYSLITNQSFVNNASVFSIHPSTYDMILKYLIKEEKIKDDKKIIDSIVQIFGNYISESIKNNNYLKISLLINHCQAFLLRCDWLTEEKIGSLMSQLGNMYFHIGNYTRAREHIEKGLYSLKKYNDRNSSKIAKNLYNLGICYREIGSYKQSINALEESLALYKNHLSDNYIGLVQNTTYLGRVYIDVGDYIKAKNLLEESVALCKKHTPGNFIETYQTITYLATLYWICGNYEKARDLLEFIIIEYKKHLHENHPDIVRALTYLGIVYIDLGYYKKAKDILEKSLELHKKEHSENNTQSTWISTFVANSYIESGEYSKAKSLLEKNLIYLRQYFGKDSIKVARNLTYLGIAYLKLGENEKAKNSFEESISIYKKYVHENHLWIIWTLEKLGVAYMNLGMYTKSEELLQKSLHAYKTHYGQSHIQIAKVMMSLGQVYCLKGHQEKAEYFFKDSLNILLKNNHPDHYIALECLADLFLKKAKLLENKSNPQQYADLTKQAQNFLIQAQDIVITYFPKQSPHLIKIQEKLKNLSNAN